MGEPSLLRRKMLLMSGLRQRMRTRRGRVNIVDNATGQAKMGELVGVLGPSGNPLRITSISRIDVRPVCVCVLSCSLPCLATGASDID